LCLGDFPCRIGQEDLVVGVAGMSFSIDGHHVVVIDERGKFKYGEMDNLSL
jgi:hypothetical protein